MTLFASQRGPLWAKGLSSEKSVKRNLFLEIDKASCSDIFPSEN